MYKKWMNDDIVSRLDLEGLLLSNNKAIENASIMESEVESKISVVENALFYTRFVSAHKADIEHNEKIMDDLSLKALELYHAWRLCDMLPDDIKGKIDNFFSFFDNEPSSVNFLAVRCTGLDLPSEPFTDIIEWTKSAGKSSFSRRDAQKYQDIELKATNDRDFVSGLEKTASDLIKYNITTEYPSFQEENLEMFERLFPSSAVVDETEFERVEDALLDLKDQLECIKQALNEAV